MASDADGEGGWGSGFRFQVSGFGKEAFYFCSRLLNDVF